MTLGLSRQKSFPVRGRATNRVCYCREMQDCRGLPWTWPLGRQVNQFHRMTLTQSSSFSETLASRAASRSHKVMVQRSPTSGHIASLKWWAKEGEKKTWKRPPAATVASSAERVRALAHLAVSQAAHRYHGLRLERSTSFKNTSAGFQEACLDFVVDAGSCHYRQIFNTEGQDSDYAMKVESHHETQRRARSSHIVCSSLY